MLAVEAIRWWYGVGFLRLIRTLEGTITRVGRSFSVPLLLRTLFAPWKRIITYSGKSIADRARAVLDNLISRIVGFCVRMIVIVTAGVMITFLAVGGIIAIILWPFLPFVAVGLIIWGFVPWQ